MPPRINRDRLLGRLETFNRIGALPGGGNCRLALSDEDRAGRDLLVQRMCELGLEVTIDAISNIVGVRGGREEVPPVMFGSHVDTVATGGRYNGPHSYRPMSDLFQNSVTLFFKVSVGLRG
jgi:beta-ureidopropionase / N-carbamoyl-L-amino-acid hydrolase